MSHVSSTHQLLTEELREYLLAKGADLAGFGSVELIEGTPYHEAEALSAAHELKNGRVSDQIL